MATISIEQVKELRDLTGVSIMLCRKALEEAGGDKEKALIILRKKGADAVSKKADRTFGAGTIASYVHGGRVGVILELASETDFVSGNKEFQVLAYDIAMHIAASNPEFIKKEDVTEEARKLAEDTFAKEVEGKPEAMKAKILEGKVAAYFADKILMEQPFIKNPDLTIANLIQNAVQKFGEKIEITRFVRYSVLGK